MDARNKQVIEGAKRAALAAAAAAAADAPTANGDDAPTAPRESGAGSALVMLADVGSARFAVHVYPMATLQVTPNKLVHYTITCERPTQASWDSMQQPIDTLPEICRLVQNWHDAEAHGELKAGASGYTMLLLVRTTLSTKSHDGAGAWPR
mmetsp:Transcript_19923/g.50776  ORF Transcript_19923/g.50776 Transcript_19923/m.50776 type:complete len:151 (+) Transcript_19923:2-454(+)